MVIPRIADAGITINPYGGLATGCQEIIRLQPMAAKNVPKWINLAIVV